jgi:hypothetical protein
MDGIKIDGNMFYKKIERIDKILKNEVFKILNSQNII